MTDLERKAAKALFPYFSKSQIVVDVGSNIGDWAEVLAANVSSMHLFEPNTILRHYSKVRFRKLPNIHYSSLALSNEHKIVEFKFWEDDHDGLSNIINNPKWDYLNPIKENILATPLDQLKYDYIDLIKIDVEGAEWRVMVGAENMLKNKLIKFIQIEYAEHIEADGHHFTEIVELVRQYGYDLFHFISDNLGDRFIKCEAHPSTYNAENFYIMDANFSQGWNKEFIENTRGMKFDFVLEMGCFEGLTSRYICDNLLNPNGRMICVDPLTDEYLPGHKDNEMFVGQYERFMRNTKGYPIELIRKPMDKAFPEMYHYRFNLIYVDGDHREDSVYRDAHQAFQLCRVGGLILFDDYNGYEVGTKAGIDRFLRDIPKHKYNIEANGYQLCIKKYENIS